MFYVVCVIMSNHHFSSCTVLNRHSKTGDKDTKAWLGYAYFHLGDYKKALDIYTEMTREVGCDKKFHLYSAICLFYLGMFDESLAEANRAPPGSLRSRLELHLAHKKNNEEKLLALHSQMSTSPEDQLTLAAVNFMRSHFQDATDMYKKLLEEHEDYLALQVYLALCYYKLDYYDVSLRMLEPYLQLFPDSAMAINLKACNRMKLWDGKAAEQELKVMIDMLASSSMNFDNDLVRHNLVVFRNGENALKVLPPLVEHLPEARMNLVIYYLRCGDTNEAHNLLKDLEPQTPQEYILKGVVNAAMDTPHHINNAKSFFQLVGASASECDTIPGRQCMASCFFLLKQFEDVLIYLESIKAYSEADDVFQINYGVSLANVGRFEEAEQALLLVRNPIFTTEYYYVSWLARCYIMNGKPRDAWKLYLTMENSDSFNMLVLVANDCYKAGHFFFAAKAFDVLQRLDSNAEYWEGKRGACCGVLQQVVAGEEKKERLLDVIAMLQANTSSPQAGSFFRVSFFFFF